MKVWSGQKETSKEWGKAGSCFYPWTWSDHRKEWLPEKVALILSKGAEVLEEHTHCQPSARVVNSLSSCLQSPVSASHWPVQPETEVKGAEVMWSPAVNFWENSKVGKKDGEWV